MRFVEQLQEASPYIRVENIAKTPEGRDIPLLVIGKPLPTSPAELVNDKRIVVYIQANIHSGEVEGKEASLMYARDLLSRENEDILKNTILLICPNLNADGNERMSKQNRTNQNGPVNGVGVRHNAQHLDMNRDGMKLETQEIRGVIANVLNRWDPSVVMDCHTTNGSYHEEPVTFTWMMNPNGDRSLINYMRDKMMPEVSETLQNAYKVDNCFYGEFIDRAKPEKGWISYAAAPRYLTNYIGIRNRLAILNENYVYADYKTRVWGCYYLIQSVMDYCSANKNEIKDLIHQVDLANLGKNSKQQVTDSFTIAYTGKPTPEKITIKAYEADEYLDENGRKRYKKTDRKRTVTVPYIADYYATKTVKFPHAYILNVPDARIVEVLKIHGISVEKLEEKANLEVERFKIEKLTGSQRLNQGHYTNQIEGHFITEEMVFNEGCYVIRTTQKLRNLAAYLLEPQSDDGLLKWNYFDRYLVPQWGQYYYPYPVYKLHKETSLKTSIVE